MHRKKTAIGACVCIFRRVGSCKRYQPFSHLEHSVIPLFCAVDLYIYINTVCSQK